METVGSLKEEVTHQLRGMYRAEKKLQISLLKCLSAISSDLLRKEVLKYASHGQERIGKLEKSFGYLQQPPSALPNAELGLLLQEIEATLQYKASPHLRDVMLTAGIQKINHYKIACYGSCRAFALALNLPALAEAMGDLTEGEKETDRRLTWLAMEKLNAKAMQPALLLDEKQTSNEQIVPA